jgi:DNA topoisomerase-6 subunit A
VKIALNDTDRKRAKQIAGYPWFAHKKAWQKEIKSFWTTASSWRWNP